MIREPTMCDLEGEANKAKSLNLIIKKREQALTSKIYFIK